MQTDDVRLYDLEPTKRFSDRAAHYAAGRPSYPLEAVTHILAGLHRPDVLDLGAGTGIATRLLRSAGARVLALEPNLSMALENAERTALGEAESLPFRDHSFDVVTAFNSFHWMKPHVALPEARRVLRARGHLAVVWNDWDERDLCTAEFVRLIGRFAGDHPPEDRDREVAPLLHSTEFGRVARRDFPNRHELDLDRLRLRVQSISYLPLDGSDADAMMRELEEYFGRFAHDGAIAHQYITCVFTALPQPSG